MCQIKGLSVVEQISSLSCSISLSIVFINKYMDIYNAVGLLVYKVVVVVEGGSTPSPSKLCSQTNTQTFTML